MNKFKLLVIAFVISAFQLVTAQVIEVKPAETTINQIARTGVSVKIELDKKTVEKQWLKLIKQWGKTESFKQGGYQVQQAMVPSVSASAVVVYTGIEADNTGTTVFIAIDLGTALVTKDSKEYDAMKKLLYDFATELYREDINNQIAEADKAVDGAVRFHDKKMEQGLDLAKSLERNKAEKARLERLFKENLDQLLKLKTDSAQNKAEQMATLDEINRLRAISEQKKNKLKEIK
jgi:hypothetical protein